MTTKHTDTQSFTETEANLIGFALMSLKFHSEVSRETFLTLSNDFPDFPELHDSIVTKLNKMTA